MHARPSHIAHPLFCPLPGPGERLFDRRLVLNRSHTFLAPLAVSKKEWDTCKPLKPYFSRLHRVILVDDDRWAGGWVDGLGVGMRLAGSHGACRAAGAGLWHCMAGRNGPNELALMVRPR